jgi:hypothetical protein
VEAQSSMRVTLLTIISGREVHMVLLVPVKMKVRPPDVPKLNMMLSTRRSMTLLTQAHSKHLFLREDALVAKMNIKKCSL